MKTSLEKYVEVTVLLLEQLQPSSPSALAGVVDAATSALTSAASAPVTGDDVIGAPVSADHFGPPLERAAAVLVEAERRGRFHDLDALFAFYEARLLRSSKGDGRRLRAAVAALADEVERAQVVDFDALLPRVSSRTEAKAAVLAAADARGIVTLSGDALLSVGGWSKRPVRRFEIDANSDDIQILWGSERFTKRGVSAAEWNELASRLSEDRARVTAAAADGEVVLAKPTRVAVDTGVYDVERLAVHTESSVTLHGPTLGPQGVFVESLPFQGWSALARGLGGDPGVR